MLSVSLDRVLAPWHLSTNKELRIVVFALSGQHAVVIEIGRFFFQVPFADHSRLVTSLFHLNCQHLLARRDTSGKVESTVNVVVLTRQDAGSRRRTDRVRAKRVGEQSTFRSESIDVGCRSDFCQTPAVCGYSMCRM